MSCGIGPTPGQGRPVMAGEARRILGTGSGYGRVIFSIVTGSQRCDSEVVEEGHASEQRNPTAVQSGNRHAALLGERRRERGAGNRLYQLNRKGWLMLNGPRRAQAGSRLPNSIGPMPEAKIASQGAA